ncbi:MAG: hypothetical protein DWQ35_16445 [Planctomycetota bacterium]|nr:MAG: hypothetical protein DWQ35_16445 [Planctomycetota bacterium]
MFRACRVSALARLAPALLLGCMLAVSSPLRGQETPYSPAGSTVVDVRVLGNRAVSLADIRGELNTRVGQPFDGRTVNEDVRALVATRKFVDVQVRTRPGPQPGTVVVVFQVFEYPKVEYIHFLGNEVRDRSLKGAIDLKIGDHLDAFSVESARDAIVAFYKERGYNKVRVDIREGTSPSDRGAVFVISEGPQQQIWDIDFIGNSIVSDGRLKTQVQAKPSPFRYTPFGKGYVNLKQIDADVEKIESYYRDLGYMLARVGRELKYNEDETRLAITYVIDEGPRFRIRNVAIRGTRVFSEQRLASVLDLKSGAFFDGPAMRKDVGKLSDIYGAVGYVMVDVNPSPRTLPSTPEIDLVYDIDEGKRYRVGRIDVNIDGDDPHTRLSVALNRLSFRPGDIVDIRKIRDSERRLRASGLFASDPITGQQPRIVYEPRSGESAAGIARQPRGPAVRGQSPDGPPRTLPPLVQLELVPDGQPYPWPTRPGQVGPHPGRTAPPQLQLPPPQVQSIPHDHGRAGR